MGTSNIYNGPKDKKDKNTKNLENSNWKALKTSVSRFISKNSGSSKKLLSNYIKCLGGKDNALTKSKSGLISGGNMINFINSLHELGLEKTLESYDIEYKGKDIGSVLSELTNKLSSEASLKEDCVARTAVVDTLSYLYNYIDQNDLSLDCLNSIDEKIISKMLTIFFSSYVFNKFMTDLESRFDRSNEEYEKLAEKERDIKVLIESVVDISIGKMNLSKKIEEPEEISKKLLKECYEYLEVFE